VCCVLYVLYALHVLCVHCSWAMCDEFEVTESCSTSNLTTNHQPPTHAHPTQTQVEYMLDEPGQGTHRYALLCYRQPSYQTLQPPAKRIDFQTREWWFLILKQVVPRVAAVMWMYVGGSEYGC